MIFLASAGKNSVWTVVAMQRHRGPADDVFGRMKPVIAACALDPRGVATFFAGR